MICRTPCFGGKGLSDPDELVAFDKIEAFLKKHVGK